MLLYKICVYFWVGTLTVIACSKYLIPSGLPNAGRGIVAGVPFNDGVEIESNPTLSIPKELTQQTQLTQYVYGTGDERYDMIMLGAGSLYNHFDPRTVYYTWKEEQLSDPAISLLPFTDYTPISFHSVSNIRTGEEMLSFYGETWFDRFDLAHSIESNHQSGVMPKHRFSINDLKMFGHCLSDTFISPSPMSNAGNGLIAGRHFGVGDIVVVSPVVVLPKELVEIYTEQSVLQNYCITVPSANVVLMPLSTAAMINHKAPNLANVKMEWYDWSPAVEGLSAKYPLFAYAHANNTLLRLEDKLQMSPQELYTAPFSPLDIAYRAIRPIAAGEEIFLDYGPTWEFKWREYIAHMQAWKVKGNSKAQIREFPLFRQYIEAPEGMFPNHWQDTEQRQCRAEESCM